jgi:transmembrane 9 superfamily protein 2/4
MTAPSHYGPRFHLGLYLSLLFGLTLTVLVVGSTDPIEALEGARSKRMTRQQKLELQKEEAETYEAYRAEGHVEVGHTKEAEFMRKYQLRNKRRKGIFRKKHSDWASILFPGVAPEIYNDGVEELIYTDLVNSKKTQVPFEFYKLPGCDVPTMTLKRKRAQRKNLGARLQGVELKPAPYILKVKESRSCMPLCQVGVKPKSVLWLRKLIKQQYRIHLSFDGLPVLMRSKELNYAVRGFPIGFVAPPDYTGLDQDEVYLYNHLKFTITYKEVLDDGGVHVTGFDVHPVSMKHEITEAGDIPKIESEVSTCDATDSPAVVNDLETYLALTSENENDDVPVIYSYEVVWQESLLDWADRWDIYVIGGPDEDIHAFAIINSLMIVLFLTGAIATIMIRTLRRDIAGYNEMQTLEEAQEETGWKLVHGDVFRPPSSHPNLFSILVGTGAQIGSAFFLTMMCSILGLTSPMKKGQMLTSIVLLYVLCGAVAGYISARSYKFCGGKAWKRNTFLTAAALPGALIAIFTVLNIFLHIVGAATAVHFFTLLAILGLWVAISTPMVFVGSFFGFRAEKIRVPVKVNQMARYIPEHIPWFANPPMSYLLGGLLPFGSVCIELFFIMSALWLHQIYYMMGFLLIVLLILVATCAEVSIVMTYLQLCAEDHRFYWKSFFNCASAGFYLFLYSLWFLVSRLDLVGVLPVVVYITYMSMISVFFSLFCGSIGVICSFIFVRSIYGALKVD